MNLDRAKRTAGLWRAGKMIGGDAHDVAETLLNELERLEEIISKAAIALTEQINTMRSVGDNWEADLLTEYREMLKPNHQETTIEPSD